MSGERLKADAVLLSLTFVWATTFTLVKGALTFVDPWTFLLLRFGGAFLILLPIAGRSVLRRDVLRAGGVLGFLLAFGYLTQTVALRHTTPSRSAFITGLYVLLVPLFSALFLRRMPGPWSAAGSVLAAVGLYVLTGSSLGDAPESFWGDLLTFSCAVSVAFHILLTGYFARKLPAVPLVVVQLGLSIVLFAVWLPWVDLRLESHPAVWLAAAVGVVVNSGVAFLQVWAQARTSAVRTSLIFALEPAFAALFSAWMGSEVLGSRELWGGGMILSGILVSELGGYWGSLVVSDA